ncbi:MAG: gliding motility lipoprotein GldD [Bacteroidota bacterium]
MRYVIVFLFLLLLNSCGDETVVKPGAELRLEYAQATYDSLREDCPFRFQKNTMAEVLRKDDCGINIVYPNMKATIYLTYQEVQEDNLTSMLVDAQKLAYGHNIKANEIFEQPRVDSLNRVYGMFYMINGEAASQSQFYVTDSTDHFVSGALYFEAKPNFDSIYPAVVYLRNDIRRIMETISWEAP